MKTCDCWSIIIYQGCLYVRRQGGHVSERVVAGGWAVQQVTPWLFVLCCGRSQTLTHHTYLTRIPYVTDFQLFFPSRTGLVKQKEPFYYNWKCSFNSLKKCSPRNNFSVNNKAFKICSHVFFYFFKAPPGSIFIERAVRAQIAENVRETLL